MQPPSKLKSWAVEDHDDSTQEPPTKIRAVEAPEAESDDEYEAVPKKSRKPSSVPEILRQSTSESLPPPTLTAPSSLPSDSMAELAPRAANTTDDDWLRSRTNRLLDLVEPGDASIVNIHAVIGGSETNSEAAKEFSSCVTIDPPLSEDKEEIMEEQVDEIFETIKVNGRLFVRNLPYTATEEDLRTQFESYGSLEEVCSPYFIPS